MKRRQQQLQRIQSLFQQSSQAPNIQQPMLPLRQGLIGGLLKGYLGGLVGDSLGGGAANNNPLAASTGNAEYRPPVMDTLGSY
jgi:hypothetical protein